MSYTEFPTDRIVRVHFKPAKPPSPCQPGDNQLCNVYEYGVTAGHAPTGETAAIPDETAVAPFTGTWFTNAPNGPPPGIWGGLTQGPEGLPDEITATAYGLDALSLFLDELNFSFTNQQLIGFNDPHDPNSNVRWNVVMVAGEGLSDPSDIFSDCVQMVADTYTFDLEWSSSSDLTYGIGIQHVSNNPDFSVPSTRPPQPVVTFTGSGSYTYKMDWVGWINRAFLIDAGNQFSDSVGGPIDLWWMTFDPISSVWRADSNFMGNTVGALGDSYHWKLSVKCFVPPSIFLELMKRSP